MQDVIDGHATALSWLSVAPLGFGVGWTVQFARRMNVTVAVRFDVRPTTLMVCRPGGPARFAAGMLPSLVEVDPSLLAVTVASVCVG
jgi:hypothetical protein